MKRISIILVAIMSIFIGLVGVSCEEASTSSSAASQTPAEILTVALANSENIQSATVDLQTSLSLDMNTSDLSEEQKALISQPIEATGQVAISQNPQVLDSALNLTFAGQTQQVGIRVLNGKAYVALKNQWYEAPEELQQALGNSGADAANAEQSVSAAQIRQVMKDLDIDPVNWMKNLEMVGDEDVNGSKTYHLRAIPDLAIALTDIVKLTQSPEFATLMGWQTTAGTTTTAPGETAIGPSPEDLQQIQTQLAQLFQDLQVDFWVSQDTFHFAKAALKGRIIPPAEEEPTGINAMNLQVAMTVLDINKAVTAQPPESPLPATDLEEALQTMAAELLSPLNTGSDTDTSSSFSTRPQS